MKKIAHMMIAASMLTAVYSCGDGSEQGSSTPIDSTNVHGTAPATYGPEGGDSVGHPVYEGQNDSGNRAYNTNEADSM